LRRMLERQEKRVSGGRVAASAGVGVCSVMTREV
jgi:hypothetical protein